MNLMIVDDQLLLERMKTLARQEREVLLTILYHLKEIERRRLYSELKYMSMLDYATKELKYSQPQACRRFAAMALLADVPQVEEKVKTGALNLTNMVLAQTVFNKERLAGRPLDLSAKLAFLEKLENTSTREAMGLAVQACPEMRAKDLEVYQIKDLELRDKAQTLVRLRGVRNLNELLHILFDQELENLKSAVPKSPANPRADSVAEIYRQVYRRDQGRCTNCHSTERVQHEHIIPKAVGGQDSLENLKLLCANCNLRAAVKYYGRKKMRSYIREPMTEYRIH